MANTFSDDINVLGLHRIVVQGTVDDPNNVANVEIFSGETDVGSTHVSANGNWHFTVAPSKPGGFEFFHAVVTDGTDNEEPVAADFALILDDPFSRSSLLQVAVKDASSVISSVQRDFQYG